MIAAPCANFNASGAIELAEVFAEEFAELAHHGSNTFAFMHIRGGVF